MEPASQDTSVRVAAIPMQLDWLDVGSWPSFAKTRPRDENDNALAAENCLVHETSNCLIASNQPDHLIATMGCEDLIVIHTDRATLVCRADMAEKIKEVQKTVHERFDGRYDSGSPAAGSRALGRRFRFPQVPPGTHSAFLPASRLLLCPRRCSRSKVTERCSSRCRCPGPSGCRCGLPGLCSVARRSPVGQRGRNAKRGRRGGPRPPRRVCLDQQLRSRQGLAVHGGHAAAALESLRRNQSPIRRDCSNAMPCRCVPNRDRLRPFVQTATGPVDQRPPVTKPCRQAIMR